MRAPAWAATRRSLPFGPSEVLLQRVVRLAGEVQCRTSKSSVWRRRINRCRRCPLPCEVVRDAEPHLGPLAGLAAGMAAIERRADAVFVCGCDVPLLVPAFVDRMFDSLGDHKIAAVYDGERFHPLAAVYRTDVLPNR